MASCNVVQKPVHPLARSTAHRRRDSGVTRGGGQTATRRPRPSCRRPSDRGLAKPGATTGNLGLDPAYLRPLLQVQVAGFLPRSASTSKQQRAIGGLVEANSCLAHCHRKQERPASRPQNPQWSAWYPLLAPSQQPKSTPRRNLTTHHAALRYSVMLPARRRVLDAVAEADTLMVGNPHEGGGMMSSNQRPRASGILRLLGHCVRTDPCCSIKLDEKRPFVLRV